MNERFFAPCPRGLESALGAELSALGGALVRPADGGVAFAGPIELAYHANLESRLASRILWQVAHGGYRDTDELYALARGVAWGRHFAVARPLRAPATSPGPRAANPRRAVGRARAHIRDSSSCDQRAQRRQ